MSLKHVVLPGSCRRGARALSSIWTARPRDSPASSSILRKKVSGCAEVSASGAAKLSNLSSMKTRPTPSAAGWSGSAKRVPSRREKSVWKPSKWSFDAIPACLDQPLFENRLILALNLDKLDAHPFVGQVMGHITYSREVPLR